MSNRRDLDYRNFELKKWNLKQCFVYLIGVADILKMFLNKESNDMDLKLNQMNTLTKRTNSTIDQIIEILLLKSILLLNLFHFDTSSYEIMISKNSG